MSLERRHISRDQVSPTTTGRLWVRSIQFFAQYKFSQKTLYRNTLIQSAMIYTDCPNKNANRTIGINNFFHYESI